MRKKIIRYALLTMVAILMISVLTGCGFAPASNMKNSKNNKIEDAAKQLPNTYANASGKIQTGRDILHFLPVYETSIDIEGNKLCVVWKGSITGGVADACTTYGVCTKADESGHTCHISHQGCPAQCKKPLCKYKYVCNGNHKILQVVHSASEDFVWVTPLHSNVDYGLNADEGTTFFRTMAVMMYDSVFGANYDAKKDYFCNDTKWVAFEIAPQDVLANSLQLTADALSLNANITSKNDSNDNVTDKGIGGAGNKPVIDYVGGGDAGSGPSQSDDNDTKINQYVGVHEQLHGVIATIQGIAMAILVAMWCIEFISQVVAERFTPETVLKTLMQLMCGILVVANANVLVAAFAQTGNILSETIGNNINPTINNGFKTAIEQELLTGLTSFNIARDFGIFTLGIGTLWLDLGALKVILFLIAPVFVQLMCAYKIISRMIMRMLELTVRITLAPIPLSFSAQRGFSPDTIKYLRKCLACALEPALMFIGIACVGTIDEIITTIVGTGDLTGTAGLFIGAVTTTLTYLVLSAYLSSTKSLAQDVIAG